MGSLEHPFSLEVAYLLPAQWPHQIPDMGSYGACCFSSVFLDPTFKLPKRLNLISWVGMIQLGSISRPKHLKATRPAYRSPLAFWAGCLLYGCLVNYRISSILWPCWLHTCSILGNYDTQIAPSLLSAQAQCCPAENHCNGELGSDADACAHRGYEKRKAGCHDIWSFYSDGTADVAATWISGTSPSTRYWFP